MSNTANLVLPYLAVGQAQKHVTVNESLRKLDAIIQLSVVSATTTAEPGSPVDGQVWIVPSGKSGTHWSAFANGSLAYYRDGAWVELSPREGWLAVVRDTDQLLAYTGSAWSLFPAAKILTVSATDKMLGRVSSGAGAAEEVAFTDQAQQLCDDTSFGAMRTTMGAAGLADANVFSLSQVVGAGSGTRRLDIDAGNGSSQGAIIGFKAAGVEKCVLGAYSAIVGGSFDPDPTWYFAAGGGTMYLYDGAKRPFYHSGNLPGKTGHFIPDMDNVCNLGSSSYRFATVYAGTGTINTSDAREKTPLQPLPDSVKRAVRGIIGRVGVYQWLGSVGAKGADGARLHVGVTAQDVRDAFLAEGEDPERWGVFCADPVVETVEVIEMVERRVPLMKDVEVEEHEHLDDSVVRKTVLRKQPELETVPLVDEAGSPVLQDGAVVVVEREKTVTEQVEVKGFEQRPVLDADGAPLVRLGLRYDQLFAMALAALTPAGG